MTAFFRRFFLTEAAVRVVSTICLVLMGSSSALADDSDGSGTPDPLSAWTPRDLVYAEDLGEMDLSRNGTVAVWVRTSVGKRDKKPERLGSLWTARLDGSGAPVQLTSGSERIGSVALSPDGNHVAFVSDREAPGADKDDADGRLWLLPLSGGEARPLTSGPRAVDDFAWIDPKTLLVVRQERPSLREQQLESDQDSATAVDDLRDHPFTGIFRVELDGESRRLARADDWVEELAVSPDGKRVILSAAQSTRFAFDAKIPPKTYLMDPQTGERTEILKDSGLLPRSFRWAPESQGFYFIDDFTNHPKYRQATVAHLHFYDLKSKTSEQIEHDWDWGIGGDYGAVPGGVVALLADGTRYRPARISADAARGDLTGPKEHLYNLDGLMVSADGSRLLYVRSSAESSPQLYAATLTEAGWQEPRMLGRLNKAYDRRPSGKTEVVRWKGALGDEVEGVLHYPYGWREGQKYPLILDIHGGPTGVDRDTWDNSWASPTVLWRQRGAFVFRVNYHGSGNYGLDWAESIRERYYELEIPDIESGVDFLIERGLVDPDRLATTGWSNGGILSAGLIVRTERYKAAIVGAADVEWISDWANVDFGAAFDNYYFGGPPWERLDHYVEKSPFFEVEKVTTPTLLHTGTEDRNVPPHQSWSFFRALQFLEKAPTRLVLYPGEPHGLRRVGHQMRKIEEDLAWIDGHLFQEWRGTPNIVEGSWLFANIQRRMSKRNAAGALGIDRQGTLIPELVSFGGLEISRFEITVDQWREFEPDAFPQVQGDLPAHGISFEKARAYAAWLSRQGTGRTYRLPTVAEAEAWQQVEAPDHAPAGLTLDLWLGRAPSPLERQLLVDNTLQPALLLKAVGSRGGVGSATWGMDQGSPLVFDLDGNVAEWATTENDNGRPMGPSADRIAGSNDPPDPRFVGLRLVAEP